MVEGDADCRRSALCREGGRCRASHPGSPSGRCVSGEPSDAGPPVIGDGTVPPFGHRTLRCEEPLPSPIAGWPRLRPAAEVRAELRSRDVWIEPLGVRLGVPSHWQPRTISAPWIAVAPQELARVAPGLRYRVSDPVFPVSALLLESHLPPDGLVALLAPESYGGEPNTDGPAERGFWGTLVLVFALQNPAAEVLATLEPALGSHAHAVSCPRDLEARYFPYRRSATREWLEWDFAEPWYRWRDVQGPWRQIGAAASWHAHGHHRSNAVDLFVRRFGATTLVVVVSTTEDPKIPVEPEALLPAAAPRDAGPEAPTPPPEVRCTLPPKGNIHWALRPTAP